MKNQQNKERENIKVLILQLFRTFTNFQSTCVNQSLFQKIVKHKNNYNINLFFFLRNSRGFSRNAVLRAFALVSFLTLVSLNYYIHSLLL